MNLNIFRRWRAERFAQLLDEANGGRRHHIRSRVDDDLAELVTVGQRVRGAQPSVDIDVDPTFRDELRIMLLAAAEQAAMQNAGGAEQGARRTGGAGSRATRGGQRTRARVRGSIIVGVAVGAIAVSGMSAASENALPGDALYGVKRSTERAQLALASSDLSRGQLFLDFAQTRLAEAIAVRDDRVGFAAVLDDMDADTRQGIKLLNTSAAQRRDAAALDAIGTFLTGQRRQITELLDSTSPANSQRVSDSLTLLDSIGRRADLLRAALQCGADPAARVDNLGPLPRACGGSRSSNGQQQSSSQESRPQNTRTPASPRPEVSAEPELTPTSDPERQLEQGTILKKPAGDTTAPVDARPAE
ncbi:hypothetical protein BDK92_3100 [Micromonospora pisi]|uniref:DUF5667 domain-containing protein n=1 Tax=Micromonospora pisi TaxID=589240 RepID=A0A495JL58_9ACTN|nr:DUF5667 domain-containing protein [Micromonospora pisi]RKR88769.1 hypothetical protein BDK92_3100 [Micromonospora pisi]